MHKLISLLLSLCLLSSNFVYAQNADKDISLSQLQTQARKDIKTYQKNWDDRAKDLLPSILAFTPVLRLQATTFASTISQVLQESPALPASERASLLRLAELLEQGKYYEASRVFDIITSKGGWDYLLQKYDGVGFFEGNRGLYWLPEYIDEFLGDTVPKAIATNPHIPAREFYVGQYDKDFVKYYIADLEVHGEYNTIRNMLDIIEENRAKLSEDELTSLLRTVYETDYYYVFDKSTEDLFRKLIKDYPAILKDRNILVYYIETIESHPALSRLTKNSLQANLLARADMLDFSVGPMTTVSESKLGSFVSEAITLESRIVAVPSQAPIFKAVLKKILPATFFLLAIGIISAATAPQAQAEDMRLLQRLQNNFDLFINADKDELQLIQQNPLSAAYCHLQAQTLHEVAHMDPEEASFVKQQIKRYTGSRQTQQPTARQELLKQLRTVKAH